MKPYDLTKTTIALKFKTNMKSNYVSVTARVRISHHHHRNHPSFGIPPLMAAPFQLHQGTPATLKSSRVANQKLQTQLSTGATHHLAAPPYRIFGLLPTRTHLPSRLFRLASIGVVLKELLIFSVGLLPRRSFKNVCVVCECV